MARLDKLRKESLKQEDMPALYAKVLHEYGVTDKKPLGRGSFADVYLLPNNHILRIEMGSGFVTAGQLKKNTLEAIDAQRCALIPRLIKIKLHQAREARNSVWILVSEAERLVKMEWTEWHKVYPTAEALAASIFQGIEKLITLGILHADISMNNVILTKEGIRFVDLDNACVDFAGADKAGAGDPRASISNNCSALVYGTDGYVSPEFVLYRKNDDVFKRLPLTAQRNLYRKNLIYAAGALVLAVLTDSLPLQIQPAHVKVAEPIRTWILQATSADPATRTIPATEGGLCFAAPVASEVERKKPAPAKPQPAPPKPQPAPAKPQPAPPKPQRAFAEAETDEEYEARLYRKFLKLQTK